MPPLQSVCSASAPSTTGYDRTETEPRRATLPASVAGKSKMKAGGRGKGKAVVMEEKLLDDEESVTSTVSEGDEVSTASEIDETFATPQIDLRRRKT